VRNEPETAVAALRNPAASADAHQHARGEIEEIEQRARAAGRKLSRSWLPRLAAVAAGLVAAWLASRRSTALAPDVDKPATAIPEQNGQIPYADLEPGKPDRPGCGH
jgi:hypothetical protein